MRDPGGPRRGKYGEYIRKIKQIVVTDINRAMSQLARGSPFNLLPDNPSPSPPVDSRSGLGVCTGNSDGNPPSWAVPLAIDGPGMAGGGSRPGDSWSCAESGRTAAASCAYIVADVEVDVVVVAAAAGAPAGDGGGGVAARGSCSSGT